MLDTIETPIAEKITQPSDRWRNWWRSLGEGDVENVCGNKVTWARFDDVLWSTRVFPSQDAAETRAGEVVAHNLKCAFQLEYLGAFPVTQ